jgi:hypothetical protein
LLPLLASRRLPATGCQPPQLLQLLLVRHLLAQATAASRLLLLPPLQPKLLCAALLLLLRCRTFLKPLGSTCLSFLLVP